MFRTLPILCVALALFAGCKNHTVQRQASPHPGNQCIKEIPAWLLSEARHQNGGTLNEKLKPPGFAIDPRTAAFIYGNLFRAASQWDEFPDVRLFVTDDSYLCIPAAQETPETLDGLLSIPSCIEIRAVDGAAFDKNDSQWRHMGYLNESIGAVRRRTGGRRIGEIIGEVGVPYRTRGYTSERVLSWDVFLTPRGLMLDVNPVDCEALVMKVDSAPEAILEYWCCDGHLSLRFVQGLSQEE